MLALTPQMTWAWVPTTHTSGHRTRLVYNPPPCSCGPWSGEGDAMPRELESYLRPEDPVASCSPVVGKGRLGPTTLVRVALVETVEAPARMPAQGGASTPSHGGREGIDGSGVSRRPVANRINASFVYYSSRRKKEIVHLINHQPLGHACGMIFIAFSSGRTTLWLRRLPPAEDLGIVWVDHLTR
jgi:hypothetical protein